MKTKSRHTQITGLDGVPVAVELEAISSLSARLQSSVLWPADPDYERVVSIWNGMINKRPRLVLQPVSADDVREVVRFARAHGVLLSVKGGGHHIAGLSLADGGLTLDMSHLRAVEIDPARRLVHVGAGCLLGDVDRATQPHALATVLGSDAMTGVAGFTLGGGFGYLTRRFGWAVDNLVEVQLVTARGEIERASETENPDLFWAIRGAGGNYGVVTRFTFRLHEVGPQVTAGLVVWPAEKVDEILALYRDASAAAPRELTLGLTIRSAPATPFIPATLQGKPIVAILACHSGDPARAAADLGPIRCFGRPIVDLIRQKPYVEQQVNLGTPQPDGLHRYWKSEFVHDLPGELLDACRQQGSEVPSQDSQLILFQLGGAALDFAPDSTAFGNRDAAHIILVAGCWEPRDPRREQHMSWVRSTWQAIAPYSSGNYVNVQDTDEDDTRTEEAYHENFERLARIKAAYDPDNLFRVNRNVARNRRPADGKRPALAFRSKSAAWT